MSDQNDRLDGDLRDYYGRLRQQQSPDVMGRVMLATEGRAALWHRIGAAGTGVLAAAAVAAIVAVVLLTHVAKTPSPTGTAHTPPPAPSASVTPSPSTTPTPTAQPLAGPPVHGFVPSDVTAISASQWWVLGENGAGCASASCTRIVHTTDGGTTFTSVPVPPIAPAATPQRDHLRFADASDGWALDATGEVWATHDGGQTWARPAGLTAVTDVEASGGSVYAITCPPAGSCTIEMSPVSQDAWHPLTGSNGAALRNLLVNGSHIWAVVGAASGTSLLASADGGATFHTTPVCPGALGISSIYAVDATTLWAACASGTEAGVYLSTNGGQSFTQVGGGVQNSATIAGVSAITAVAGSGTQLVRSTDGGRSFRAVVTANPGWTVVGFTTSSNGFALDQQPSGGQALWRTNDAGATWHTVHFP